MTFGADRNPRDPGALADPARTGRTATAEKDSRVALLEAHDAHIKSILRHAGYTAHVIGSIEGVLAEPPEVILIAHDNPVEAWQLHALAQASIAVVRVLPSTPGHRVAASGDVDAPVVDSTPEGLLSTIRLLTLLRGRVADDIGKNLQQQLDYLVHDLKSPVAAVLVNLARLKAAVPENEANRQVADSPNQLVAKSLEATRRLERMILDLLDLSRMRGRTPKLDVVKVPLEDLIDEAMAVVGPSASHKGVVLEIELGQWALRLIEVDFDLMTRVLVNLLDNAIRHAPAASPVRVEANGTRQLELSVVDRGAGVPSKWRERIFQLRAKRGAHRGGQGLGLAFAKQVATAHGMDIGVRAEPSGGSRFYLEFPRGATIK